MMLSSDALCELPRTSFWRSSHSGDSPKFISSILHSPGPMQQGFFVNVTAGRAVYKNAERPEASGWGVATLLREILAMDVKAGGGKGRDLMRRMFYIPALIVAAVLLACVATLLALSEKAEATFPGKNGRIAYESNGVIYTINPDGSGKTKVTGTSTAGYSVDYSPNGKRIAASDGNGKAAEIYTI